MNLIVLKEKESDLINLEAEQLSLLIQWAIIFVLFSVFLSMPAFYDHTSSNDFQNKDLVLSISALKVIYYFFQYIDSRAVKRSLQIYLNPQP